MVLSQKATQILAQLTPGTKLGDLRKIAAAVKINHDLAMELWASGQYLARQLAILMMDKKLLTSVVTDTLLEAIAEHPHDEKLQLADWLLANQLMKDKRTIALIESWQNSPLPLKRRIYWYYQARLRWVGQVPPPNTEVLLAAIEQQITKEVAEVQWAMNFTAAQIGIFEPVYRARCIALGERTGLYKDEMVAKNCTPSYLPLFIEIQVAKLKK